jgi:hypothetical protein
LPFVKQRPLLTTRPSITGDIQASSTWYGTRFTAHNIIELKRVMRKVAQSEGSSVGRVSDAVMG